MIKVSLLKTFNKTLNDRSLELLQQKMSIFFINFQESFFRVSKH